jgi:hypothetical protein
LRHTLIEGRARERVGGRNNAQAHRSPGRRWRGPGGSYPFHPKPSDRHLRALRGGLNYPSPRLCCFKNRLHYSTAITPPINAESRCSLTCSRTLSRPKLRNFLPRARTLPQATPRRDAARTGPRGEGAVRKKAEAAVAAAAARGWTRPRSCPQLALDTEHLMPGLCKQATTESGMLMGRQQVEGSGCGCSTVSAASQVFPCCRSCDLAA